MTSVSSIAYTRELDVALEAARRAAAVILGFYEARTAETYTKGDGSPVTDADLAADQVIRETIAAAFPEDAMLTEEGAKDLARIENPRCWIVDPLDGTEQFVKGTDRFEVFVALSENGRPVVAVSAHPPTGVLHAAVIGQGAWRIDGDVRQPLTFAPAARPPILASSKWYRGREGREMILRVAETLGSAAPPILEVGFQPRDFDEGLRTYDAFIGLWPEAGQSIAHEWDLAASDLIVNEAGGRFTDIWGRPHQYNKRDTTTSGGILVTATVELQERILAAFATERPEIAPPPDPADNRQ